MNFIVLKEFERRDEAEKYAHSIGHSAMRIAPYEYH